MPVLWPLLSLKEQLTLTCVYNIGHNSGTWNCWKHKAFTVLQPAPSRESTKSIDAKELTTIMNFHLPGNNIYDCPFLWKIIRSVLQVQLFCCAAEFLYHLNLGDDLSSQGKKSPNESLTLHSVYKSGIFVVMLRFGSCDTLPSLQISKLLECG